MKSYGAPRHLRWGDAMNTNVIYTGDSAEVLKTFPDECIDLSVQSPPYDNLRTYEGEADFDFETIAKQLFRVTKQGGVCVWVVGDATVNGSETGTSFRQALYFMQCGFNLYDTMFYKRFNGIPTSGRYYDVIEYMFIFSKGRPKSINFIADRQNKTAGHIEKKDITINKGQRKEWKNKTFTTQEVGRRTNVWEYLTGQGDTNGHPAPFPEGLARDHILSWSNAGDIVLDCFAGSGTTLKMAKELSRQYIGIERVPKYVAIAEKRLLATNVPLFPTG